MKELKATQQAEMLTPEESFVLATARAVGKSMDSHTESNKQLAGSVKSIKEDVGWLKEQVTKFLDVASALHRLLHR